MRRRISRKSKIREKRGEGTGASYRPWIKARELNSIGVTCNIVDWKHGRTVELLSQGEAWLYYLLRWRDDVVDIREQFPLDLDETNIIADNVGIMRVNQGTDNMTTDLLVSFRDGSMMAYSMKSSRKEMDSPRMIEKLWIEKMYWKTHGIQWKQVYKEDLNPTLVNNIRLCVEYYDKSRVFDETSMLKHLIATKKITVDMEHGILDFGSLVKIYREDILWNRSVLPSTTF